MLWNDMIRFDMTWYGMTRHLMIGYDNMIRYMIWYDTIWYELIWYELIW